MDSGCSIPHKLPLCPPLSPSALFQLEGMQELVAQLQDEVQAGQDKLERASRVPCQFDLADFTRPPHATPTRSQASNSTLANAPSVCSHACASSLSPRAMCVGPDPITLCHVCVT